MEKAFLGECHFSMIQERNAFENDSSWLTAQCLVDYNRKRHVG